MTMTMTTAAPARAGCPPNAACVAVSRFEIERVLAEARMALRSLRRAALMAFDDGAPLEVVRDEVDDVISCARRSTSVLCLAIGGPS